MQRRYAPGEPRSPDSSVRFSFDCAAAGARQEIEITPAIRLQHMLYVQTIVAPRVLRFKAVLPPGFRAQRELFFSDEQFQLAFRAIEKNLITCADSRSSARSIDHSRPPISKLLDHWQAIFII